MHPFTITDQLVDDTLTTALEGGINYWATAARVDGAWPAGPSRYNPDPDDGLYASEVLTHGGRLIIDIDPEVVDDDPDGLVKAHNTLTLTALKRGIRKYCELRKTTPAAIDDNPLDASEADVVVQLAIFGEIVFG